MLNASGEQHGNFHRAVSGIDPNPRFIEWDRNDVGDHASSADTQLFVIGTQIDHVAVMHVAKLDGR